MTSSLTDAEARALVDGYPHWYHRIEVRPGIVTPGINESALHLQSLDLPADCSGLRVLDLGARDGFFSFEMERRGAEVLAIDYMPADRTGFSIAAEILQSRVTYRQANIYHLDPAEIGTFDIVLFLGLLYHLPDPIGALRIVRACCRSSMYLETLVIDEGVPMNDGSLVPLGQLDERLLSVPLMQFFPGTSCNDDPTNFWGPNVRCVETLLEETEFSVSRVVRLGRRAPRSRRLVPSGDLEMVGGSRT
jgi:tRNA (mo5U34)-methyltransferase